MIHLDQIDVALVLHLRGRRRLSGGVFAGVSAAACQEQHDAAMTGRWPRFPARFMKFLISLEISEWTPSAVRSP